MGTGSRAVQETTVRFHVTADQRAREHRFFTAMAALCALLVFVGFAPTYYLRSLTDQAPLPPLVHLHAAVSTGWIVMFLAQTSLVTAGRTDIHRRLGIAGVVLAIAVLVIGWMTAIDAARRGVAPPGAPPQPGFLLIPLGTVLSFAGLAGVGIGQRRRSETHKRLMLLATIAILTPALARFRYYGFGGPPVAIGGTLAMMAACLVYDRRAHGRVHPAFRWGAVFLTATLIGRFAFAWTDGWRAVGAWLIR
jgi:hypothetical protein